MTDEQNSENANEVKRYQLPNIINVGEIKSKMISESVKDSTRQRFGFFSVMHSNFLADEYYSHKKVIEKDKNGKIKTEPRGIYAKATKKGKFIDSYFNADFLKEDKAVRERIEELAKAEKDKSLDKVKSSRTEKNFKVIFKPSGIKEYQDLIYPDKMNYEIPIWKEPLRGENIDFKNRKVNIEQRGIYTQPVKDGPVCFKGVLFSYNELPKSLQNKFQEETNNEIKARLDKVKERKENKSKSYKKPFLPNNVMKCDTFQPNKDLYGLEQKYASSLNASKEKEMKRTNHSSGIYAKHDRTFKPASLSKSVSDLFLLNFL